VEKYCFLAYSSESDDGALVAHAIARVKTALEQAGGWTVMDWREPVGGTSISEQVASYLQQADLLIVEGSDGNPNVAFEAGFARALGLPFFVVKKRISPPLPVDFGDPEFFEYPDELGDTAGFDVFVRKVTDALARQEGTSISSGHRALRRALRGFLADVQDGIGTYSADHPMLHLLSGWVGSVGDNAARGTRGELVVDPVYYLPSFSALRGWGNGRSWAVADMTSFRESFWGPDHAAELSQPISERIFLVDWTCFFENGDKLGDYIEVWRCHLEDRDGQRMLASLGGEEEDSPDSPPAGPGGRAVAGDDAYQIYVAAKRPWDGDTHPFARRAGDDLLIVEPDTVGSYIVDDDGRIRVCFRRDPAAFRDARHFFERLRRRAVPFDPAFDVQTLRRAWLRVEDLGQWDPNWGSEPEERPPSYYRRYDAHVRCWIPRYSELIELSAAAVEGEIVTVHQEHRTPLDLLEIGYGTGALTEKIVNWLTDFNEPFGMLRRERPVRSYRGIDGQVGKHERTTALREAGARWLPVQLDQGTLLGDLPADPRYDVVFSSLVFHQLPSRDHYEESLRTVVGKLFSILRPGGRLVIADVFSPADQEEYDHFIDRWRRWMIRRGLDEKSADGFLRHNDSLIHAPTVGDVVRMANPHTSQEPNIRNIGMSSFFPFSVLTFQRG
jgi:SAM-dependent methyltransferase